MGRNIKNKHDFEHFVYVQSNKHSNWININNRSFLNHSLNDKSLQVTEIHDLNIGSIQYLKIVSRMTGKVETRPDLT